MDFSSVSYEPILWVMLKFCVGNFTNSLLAFPFLKYITPPSSLV